MAAATWLLVVALLAPIAVAQTSGAEFVFRCGFDGSGNNGNRGIVDCNGPWWEFLEWGGVGSGHVTVETADECPRIVTPGSPTTSTQPPTTEPPLAADARYTEKEELTVQAINDQPTTPTNAELEIPTRGPVTQIMASITMTAVTIRSHLLSAVVLGLLIAVAAVVGVGRRSEDPLS